MGDDPDDVHRVSVRDYVRYILPKDAVRQSAVAQASRTGPGT